MDTAGSYVHVGFAFGLARFGGGSSLALTDMTWSAPAFLGCLNGLRTELACTRLASPRNFLPLSAFDIHSPFPLSIFPSEGNKQDRHNNGKIREKSREGRRGERKKK